MHPLLTDEEYKATEAVSEVTFSGLGNSMCVNLCICTLVMVVSLPVL